MKLTEKYSPTQFVEAPWALYSQCESALGVILDNKFDRPHIHVYEHMRHTAQEVFNHPIRPLDMGLTKLASFDQLCAEEGDILGTLMAPEDSRRLNIIGDVGVGKSTFLRHVIESALLHNPAKAEFPLTPDGVRPQAASPGCPGG